MVEGPEFKRSLLLGINRLTTADESFNHQIADTFASVSTADYGWTEKVAFIMMRKDAKLQVGFGVGKYTNRNVFDGHAIVKNLVEQRTVRASRELNPADQETSVGPIHYQIVEPFQKIRLVLDKNEAQPIQFDLMFHAAMPAFFEGRDIQYQHGRNRSNVVRYHQPGTLSGWIMIDGERHEVNPDEWYGFRDHSWGQREPVGAKPPDLAPTIGNFMGAKFHVNWFVSQIRRPDGSLYELAYYFHESDHRMEYFSGFINEADGTQIPALVYPEINYRARDMAPMSGQLHVVTGGRATKIEERLFTLEAIHPDAGFRLNTAWYGQWNGGTHANWRGKLHVEGDCVADTDEAFSLAKNPGAQCRDRPVFIREGNNSGYADLETLVIGDWPAAKIL